MNGERPDRSESRFEYAISYLLIAGVVTSLFLEVIGILLFRRDHGRFAIAESKEVLVHGRDFFHFIVSLSRGEFEGTAGLFLMTLGITVLILTPYLRVILSVFYFAWTRNIKYTLITLFVLVILSLSLAIH